MYGNDSAQIDVYAFSCNIHPRLAGYTCLPKGCLLLNLKFLNHNEQ